MDWHSCGVYGDEKKWGGFTGSIIGSSNCKSEATMYSVTNWCKDGCCFAVELGAGGLNDLEGEVHGSLSDGCQGGEQEVRND